ncbi:histidine kinase dimerization/phosphoacceptor domain -containing protein [Marispirochaeta sp.]|uniref:histidine kinase dimerization/phosphoacceptor domain -containing protein n=1 Tax=Marispirochaeta sp. TaxID=2038653 RepID=UPI0029C8694D|nr:histidine kinase dimerization/phosphoacceptor domain -containing protein [Marispirochaeta sp.]
MEAQNRKIPLGDVYYPMLKNVHLSSFKVLFSAIVGVSLIPALMIIIWTGVEHGASLEESVRDEAFRQVESLSLVQLTISRSIRQTLTTLSTLDTFAEGDFESQQAILEAVLGKNPDYLNISSVDAYGIVRASASSQLEIGTDLTGRRHIRNALAGKEFVAGEYVLSYVDQVPAFPFALTLRNKNGRIIGALTAVYRLSTYRTIFERLGLPEETILGILDYQGTRIFFHPQKETNPIGKPIKESVWEGILEGGNSGTLVDIGSDGISRFYAYSKITLYGESEPYLYIVLGIPEKNAARPPRLILLRNLVLIVAAALMSIVISSFLGHLTLGRKLNKLSRTVGSIQAGDLSARTGIVDPDSEVGQVAEAIDNMANRLEERNLERDKTERVLSEALSERETLLKEVHHRVKNNMQLILSILHLEQQNSSDIEAFSLQLENRILAMSTVHEMMYQSESVSEIEMEDFLERLGSVTRNLHAGLVINVEAERMVLSLEVAVPLSLIVNELLTNSAKYGKSPDGISRVEITMTSRKGTASLSVADHGPGFPESPVQNNPSNLGMLLVSTLSEQLGGSVTISSGEGAGVTVEFPLKQV